MGERVAGYCVQHVSAVIQDHIISTTLDFLSIVETHHESSFSQGLIASTPPNYFGLFKKSTISTS